MGTADSSHVYQLRIGNWSRNATTSEQDATQAPSSGHVGLRRHRGCHLRELWTDFSKFGCLLDLWPLLSKLSNVYCRWELQQSKVVRCGSCWDLWLWCQACRWSIPLSQRRPDLFIGMLSSWDWMKLSNAALCTQPSGSKDLCPP